MAANLDVLGVLGVHRHADADRDLSPHGGDQELTDRAVDLLGHLQRARQAGVGQEHQELLTAVAAGEVAVTHRGVEGGAGSGEPRRAAWATMLRWPARPQRRRPRATSPGCW